MCFLKTHNTISSFTVFCIFQLSTTPQTKKSATAVENKKENQTEEKKVEEVKQTVIEKATPEESSGTE